VAGVGATFALAHASRPFALLEAKSGLLAWALPFLLVGVPAFVMGGTLPALVRSLAPESGKLDAAGGRLYAANTAGGILGALLSPFVLLPWLGVRHTAFVAAALNLAAATGALALHRLLQCPQKMTLSTGSTRPTKGVRLALVLYAIAGGIALGYEVVWSQAIVQFLSTRSFAFSIVLATYLAGLVTGSALYARIADRVRDPWGIFGLLIAAAGLVALLEIAILGNWLMNWQSNAEAVLRAATGSELAAMCSRFVVAAFGIIFAPTVLLGAAFPVAL
jgi:spermidine synthase